MSNEKNTVFVCGPQGCGKTTNAEALRKHFGCAEVIDDWFTGGKVTRGALHLTFCKTDDVNADLVGIAQRERIAVHEYGYAAFLAGIEGHPADAAEMVVIEPGQADAPARETTPKEHLSEFLGKFGLVHIDEADATWHRVSGMIRRAGPGSNSVLVNGLEFARALIDPGAAITSDGHMSGGVPGYERLAAHLCDAYEQAANGKGKERHATGEPWHEQPILSLGGMTGPGGPAFQAMKKTREALGMIKRGENAAARRELLGAIVYTAAILELLSQEGENDA